MLNSLPNAQLLPSASHIANTMFKQHYQWRFPKNRHICYSQKYIITWQKKWVIKKRFRRKPALLARPAPPNPWSGQFWCRHTQKLFDGGTASFSLLPSKNRRGNYRPRHQSVHPFYQTSAWCRPCKMPFGCTIFLLLLQTHHKKAVRFAEQIIPSQGVCTTGSDEPNGSTATLLGS